tara:strand:+ start:185 stop:388 length:204 start_codon:yes stop_codon:yes gene_type:complete
LIIEDINSKKLFIRSVLEYAKFLEEEVQNMKRMWKIYPKDVKDKGITKPRKYPSANEGLGIIIQHLF